MENIADIGGLGRTVDTMHDLAADLGTRKRVYNKTCAKWQAPEAGGDQSKY